MNIEVTRINQGIEKDPKEYIRAVNEDYLYKLKKIADDIAENHNEKPVILLSGPSGSGKTTTAMMIEKMLDDMGHETHTLSMDNWFCPLTEAERLWQQREKWILSRRFVWTEISSTSR